MVDRALAGDGDGRGMSGRERESRRWVGGGDGALATESSDTVRPVHGQMARAIRVSVAYCREMFVGGVLGRCEGRVAVSRNTHSDVSTMVLVVVRG